MKLISTQRFVGATGWGGDSVVTAKTFRLRRPWFVINVLWNIPAARSAEARRKNDLEEISCYHYLECHAREIQSRESTAIKIERIIKIRKISTSEGNKNCNNFPFPLAKIFHIRVNTGYTKVCYTVRVFSRFPVDVETNVR